MNIKIIAVGKLKEKYLKDASGEYIKRLGRFCNIEIVEIEEYRLSDKPSQSEIKKALIEEGTKISKECSGFKTALCIEGKQLTSVQLAEKIEFAGVNGFSTISFIIGSSYGLDDSIKKSADICLSMSKMTFPHQLARIMLLEQVYRGYQILNNGKYHK